MTTSGTTTTSTVTPLSHRDRAVLRAVAAGRCVLSGSCGQALLVDGLCCADQFLWTRLAGAGLIAAPGPGPARLTLAGMALLDVARTHRMHEEPAMNATLSPR